MTRIFGNILLGPEFLLLLLALCTLAKIYDYAASKGMYSLMFLLHPTELYLNKKQRKGFYQGKQKMMLAASFTIYSSET